MAGQRTPVLVYCLTSPFTNIIVKLIYNTKCFHLVFSATPPN